MNAVFAPDGALLRAWSRWWHWAWTSCCWALLCLPVITMPAATLWLITQQRRYARGEASLSPAESVRYLTGHLFPALPLAGCHLGAAALVIIGLFGPSPGGPYSWVVLITSSLAGVTWLLLAPWTFVIFERTGRTVAAIKTAYRLALTRIDLAVTGATAVLIAGAAAVLLFTRVPYLGPLLALAVPAAVASLSIMLHDRASALAPRDEVQR
ncbi:hypothetical protein [Microlunatus parietis]|uniref:Uncharacterized protein n=1 Tax=Microlunatus parietis TaxID=682979 RepID=A0A7Y9I4M8_9ACTN|nr:hypothetical protein [Microlunatus parietis]NYE70013.1 hypothetical protein [Microlunatus parietis]